MKKFFLTTFLLFSALLPATPGFCTVTVQTPTVSYAADGTTTTWPFSFKVFLSTEVEVYVQDSLGVKTLVTSNYTVNVNAGNVVYPSVASGLSPIASGNTIIIQRAEPLSQLLHLVSQGTFDAGNIETALDKLTMIAQDQAVAIAAGVAGPQGPTGATGPQGSTGSTGPTGPAGTPTWKGAWSSGTAYAIGDAVYDSTAGASYVCKAAHTNHEPPNASYWDVMTQKGDTGATGPTGPAGSGSGDVLGPATNHASYIPQWNGANSKTLLDGVLLDIDGTMAGNADTAVATQKATKTYADTKAAKGANSDITSLAGLSTPLSVAQGGSGAATLTIHGVVVGQGTSAVHITSAGTAAQVLTSNGASADPTFQAVPGGSGALLSISPFTSSGTWTRPAGCTHVLVKTVGGGGGGGDESGGSSGDHGSGGGSGAYSERYITSPGTTETVTVGAAGGSLADGGDTSFGTWLTAGGGKHGTRNGGAGGAGGTATNGDINISGQAGATGTNGDAYSGFGGQPPFGYGITNFKPNPNGGSGLNGYSGTGYGVGGNGSGYAPGNTSGGSGTAGIVTVYEYA